MRYFLSFIFFISTSFATYPVFTNTSNYIVYETGLVIPPGAENISFNFVELKLKMKSKTWSSFVKIYLAQKFLKQ